MYSEILRSINIPVKNGNRFDHNHPIFPTVNLSMTHGDNPYNKSYVSSGGIAPTFELFYPMYLMRIKFSDYIKIDCTESQQNSPKEQSMYNETKDHIYFAYKYMSDYLLSKYQINDESHVDNMLRGMLRDQKVVEYAKPFFSKAERGTMLGEIKKRIMAIGGGDFKKGKKIVSDRYDAFLENK